MNSTQHSQTHKLNSGLISPPSFFLADSYYGLFFKKRRPRRTRGEKLFHYQPSLPPPQAYTCSTHALWEMEEQLAFVVIPVCGWLTYTHNGVYISHHSSSNSCSLGSQAPHTRQTSCKTSFRLIYKYLQAETCEEMPPQWLLLSAARLEWKHTSKAPNSRTLESIT